MNFPLACYLPDTLKRKAKLARRRSRLVWPEMPLRHVGICVRVEAQVTLQQSVTEYWRYYRRCADAKSRAQYRSLLRAKITAIRLLSI